MENAQTNDIYIRVLFCDGCGNAGNKWSGVETKWEVMNVAVLQNILRWVEEWQIRSERQKQGVLRYRSGLKREYTLREANIFTHWECVYLVACVWTQELGQVLKYRLGFSLFCCFELYTSTIVWQPWWQVSFRTKTSCFKNNLKLIKSLFFKHLDGASSSVVQVRPSVHSLIIISTAHFPN